MGSILHTSQKL